MSNDWHSQSAEKTGTCLLCVLFGFLTFYFFFALPFHPPSLDGQLFVFIMLAIDHGEHFV